MHLLYVTVPSREEALSLARALVQEKLVACVNVSQEQVSFYEWEGVLQSSSEVVMIGKCASGQVAKTIDRIRELHSYQCPCILSMPVQTGNKAFITWVEQCYEGNDSSLPSSCGEDG